MIEKKAVVKKLGGLSPNEDLAYWLTLDPALRVEAVEILRRQVDGSSIRLQRVARVIQRAQS